MQPQIIIRKHQPLLKAALAIVASTLLVLAAWGLYNHARNTSGHDFAKAETEREGLLNQQKELSVQLRTSRAEISKLRAELAYYKQSETIDGEACKAVRNSLNVLENESAKLREQLAFYKGIIDPKQARAGVRVQDIQIKKQADHFHMELVLIQSVREESRIAGTADITIEGINKLVPGSPAQTLELKPLVTGGDKDWVFSFKYYEQFSTDFKLPVGFEPGKLVVTMKAVNDRPVAADEYPWQTLVSAQETTVD